MSVKVNVDSLRAFEQPLLKNNQAFIDVLHSLKKCKDAIGEGTGVEEAIERNGIAMEKAFNEEVVPATRNVLQTLTASADNAEDIRKVMASFESVNTSGASEGEVKQGVRPASFGSH